MESGEAADPVAAAAAAADQPDGEALCGPGAPGARECSDGVCTASPPARLASAAAGADDGQSGEDKSDGHSTTVRIQPLKSGPAQNCKSRSCCRRSRPPVGCAPTDAGRCSWRHLFQFQYDWFRLELGLVHGAAVGTRWPVTTREFKWCNQVVYRLPAGAAGVCGGHVGAGARQHIDRARAAAGGAAGLLVFPPLFSPSRCEPCTVTNPNGVELREQPILSLMLKHTGTCNGTWTCRSLRRWPPPSAPSFAAGWRAGRRR